MKEKCDACNGSTQCQHCDGTGWRGGMPGVIPARVGCVLCGGNGEDVPGNGKCGKCGGEGEVEVEARYPFN